MKQLRFFLSLLSFLLIGGCQADNVFPLSVTPKVFLVGLPVTLSSQTASAILNCAKIIPDRSLLTINYSEPYPEPAEFNLLIWQGNSALNTDGLTSFVIVTEEIVVIVSPENNLTSLSLTDLRSIFGGKIQDWSAIPQSELSGPIELGVYYDIRPLRLIFDDVFLRELTVSTSALIMPSQAEVNSFIEDNMNSISYIVKSHASVNTRILPIPGVSETANLTILVIFQENEKLLITPTLECLRKNNIH